MKHFIKNIYLLLLLLASCTDTETMDSTFTLEVKGYAEEECFTFGEEQPLYLWASKNWADSKTSLVEYRIDPTVLEDYNSTEHTSYKLLPESCYRLIQDSFFVDDDAQFAKFKIMYTPEQIIAEGGQYGVVEYALPVRIYVDGVPMAERYGSVVVGFLVNKALLSLGNTKNETVYTIEPSKSQEIMVSFETTYDNLEWISLDFNIGGQLVSDYNAAHGTNYLEFPKEDVTYIATEFRLNREASVDSSAFYADMANLDPLKQYLLAVQVDSITSTKCKIDPENSIRYFLFYNTRLPQSIWTVTTSSTLSYEGSVGALIDDEVSSSSYWIWDYDKQQLPEDITFTLKDFNQLAVIEKFELFTRVDNWGKKGPKTMKVSYTKDLETWTEAGTFSVPKKENGEPLESYEFVLDKPVECIAIKLSITEMDDNGIWFSEIYTSGKLIDNPNPPQLSTIQQGNWKVEVTSSSDGSGATLNNDNLTDYWLWGWWNFANLSESNPENITYTLTDLNAKAVINKIEVHAYQGANPGWLGAKDIAVQISTDGGSSWKTIKNFVAPQLSGDTTYEIELDESVECNAIRLSITSGYTEGIAFSEIIMHGEVVK